MTKEISQVSEMDQLPSYLNSLFKQWDLPVSCASSLTKKGRPRLSFSSPTGSTSIDAGTILPVLQKGRTSLLFRLAADCFSGIINKLSPTLLGAPVASFMDSENAAASGFTWYARDAVLGADIPGSFIVPCKLTTHANIYKILGRYGSLYSQNKEGGVILCPITRHRIQTAEQAAAGSDPCDVTLIAYLAQKFPDKFGRLLSDFAASCRVLDPQEALTAGTGDKKFIIENYFPL